MKRGIVIALAFGLLAIPAAWAQKSDLSVNMGGAMTLGQRFPSADPLDLDLHNTRLGAWCDVMFELVSPFSLGTEIGLYVMMAYEDNETVMMEDIPVCMKAAAIFDRFECDVLAGALFTLDRGDSTVYAMNMMGGIRFGSAQLYLEADYIVKLGYAITAENSSYPRFACGLRFSLL